jgi:hypothetical protein
VCLVLPLVRTRGGPGTISAEPKEMRFWPGWSAEPAGRLIPWQSGKVVRFRSRSCLCAIAYGMPTTLPT